MERINDSINAIQNRQKPRFRLKILNQRNLLTMSFNELNSVEHYIIHQLSDTNLNNKSISEMPLKSYNTEWQFQSAEQLGHMDSEVLIESQVKDANRLNPEIKARRNYQKK